MPANDKINFKKLKAAYNYYLYEVYGEKNEEMITDKSVLYLADEDYVFDSFRNYDYEIEVYYNVEKKLLITIISNEFLLALVTTPMSYKEIAKKIKYSDFEDLISQNSHGISLDDLSELIDCTLRKDRDGILKTYEKYKNIAKILI